MIFNQILLLGSLSFSIYAGIQDLRCRRISNKVSFINIAFAIVYRFNRLVGFEMVKIIIGIFMGLVFLYKVGSIGGGDFKNILASSLIFPNESVLSLIISLSLVSIIVQRGVKEPPIMTYFASFFIITITLRYLL